MKQINADLGGRPFANDDLVVLQHELTVAVEAQFLGKGPFIVSGCAVSGSGPSYNVAAGIVFLDGQMLRFAGAGAVTLPAQFQAGLTIYSDPRPYQTGGTKNCMREVPAVLVAADSTYAGGEFLALDTWGGKRWDDVVRASVRCTSEVQMVANVDLADYAANGLGKPGSEAWGWGLCDGQGGRADLGGRFIAGLDPSRADYDTVGDRGGEEQHILTISETPRHDHGNGTGQFDYNQLLRKAPLGSNTTAGTTDGSGNGGLEPDILSSQPMQPSGGNQPHENRPPFYVLAMRQWVGL